MDRYIVCHDPKNCPFSLIAGKEYTVIGEDAHYFKVHNDSGTRIVIDKDRLPRGEVTLHNRAMVKVPKSMYLRAKEIIGGEKDVSL